jgi:hypothetical protein
VTDADATRPVSFRLTDAKAMGVSPGRLARSLVLDALDEPDSAPPGPEGRPRPAPPAADARLRRAVWVLLVALGPDLDEESAESLLREHFDP